MAKFKKSKRFEELQDKFRSGLQAMQSCLVERDEEIRVVMVSVLCHEHALLVGTPGTGKSLIADNVRKFFDIPKEEYFHYMLTRYTDPMELFGPVDVMQLTHEDPEERAVRRLTNGFLPGAKLAFIDEFFKGSPAIINTNLLIMNERRFKYGTQEFECPLRSMIACSNEFAQDAQDLAAALDRFLLRKVTKSVSSAEGLGEIFDKALEGVKCEPAFEDHASFEEVDEVAGMVNSLPWTKTAREGWLEIVRTLKVQGVDPSDRRLMKSVAAVRASAFLSGRDEVDTDDMDVLNYIMWRDPAQITKCQDVVNKVAAPIRVKVNELRSKARDAVANFHDKPKELYEALRKIRTDLKLSRACEQTDSALAYVEREMAKAELKEARPV